MRAAPKRSPPQLPWLGVRCTPESSLAAFAKRIVHDVGDAISSISGNTNDLEGPLRIKVPTTLTTVFLARVLARFQHAHPNVSLDVVVIDRTVNPVEEGFEHFNAHTLAIDPVTHRLFVGYASLAIPLRLAVFTPNF